MRSEFTWRSFRVNYHEEEKTDLILNTFAKVVRQPREYDAETVILKTHWLGGPHVVMHLHVPADQNYEGAERILRETDAWLKEHPSRTHLTEERYRKLAAELAKLESYEGVVPPLGKNNTVHEVDEHPPIDTPLDEVRNGFRSQAVPLLMSVAELKGSDKRSFWRQLAQFLACVGYFCGPAGLSKGHLSFRSHAESFLADAESMRARFAAFDSEMRAAVVNDIRDLEAYMTGSGPTSELPGLIDPWWSVLTDTKSRLDQVVPSLDASIVSPSYPQQKLGKLNAFVVRALRGPLSKLKTDARFISYRMLISLFYECLPVLSIRPVERFALCFAVAEACEEIFDVDWRRYFG